ncbi:MAG: Gfo/Idh/MocA family oxidoreductase [Clostridia bacterium]|nr:Gfo/Idh/MocA family oxidoreductase [Clostridia bacterium]
MTQKTPFRWCFVGTGTLARQVAKEITESGRHVLCSVVSRRFEKAVEFAEQYGGKACADADEAIAMADAVYVVTPHTSHYAYVKRAIELGKPVLCEKPFTVSAPETRELFALAREKGVYIVEGMWTWFAPVARKIAEWVASGRLGTIRDVTTKYLVHVIHYAPRLSDPQLAGGALLDSGVYPVTYLYRLFGKPTEIRCTGTIEGGVDLSDEIELTFEGVGTLRIDLSIVDPRNEEYIRVTGTTGEIFADHFHYADRAELRDADGQIIETVTERTTLLNEFDLAAQEILDGRTESAYIPPRATMDVMEILDECRRQIGLVYPFERS